MYSVSLKDSTDISEVMKTGMYDFLSLVISRYGTFSISLFSVGKNLASISRDFFCGGLGGFGGGVGLATTFDVDFIDRLLAVLTLLTDAVDGDCTSSIFPGVNVVILELLDGASGVGSGDVE